MIFWGKGKGGWGSISSIALYRYSTCSLLALLCRGLEQEHAGGNFGAFISKLLSHYRTDVSWLNWYLVLTVSCGKPSLPPVSVGYQQHSLSGFSSF